MANTRPSSSPSHKETDATQSGQPGALAPSGNPQQDQEPVPGQTVGEAGSFPMEAGSDPLVGNENTAEDRPLASGAADVQSDDRGVFRNRPPDPRSRT
jgi:hypothetical protein